MFESWPVPSVNTWEKTAVTDCVVLIATVQVGASPVQAPRQARNTAPLTGVAVSTPNVPRMYALEQEDPQLIPGGLLVTVPPAEPPIATVRVKLEAVLSPKTAVTDVSEVRVKTHGPVPLHPPPLQPVKADVPLGAAVS